MTDDGILQEFYIHQELQSREEEQRRAITPHCSECKYEGQVYPHTTLCPVCGAEMILPTGGSDQTTFTDGDFAQTVRDELDMELPENI